MNKAFVDKLVATEEEIKKLRAKAEAMKAQKIEDDAKLDFALVEIEARKREVHESQCEIASLECEITSLAKKVKILNNHQKLMPEAL